MAKTIGKDKGSAARSRAAAMRTRAGGAAEAEPVGDLSNDEPRDEDIVVADEPADVDATVEPALDDAESPGVVDDAGERALTLPSEGGLARQPASAGVARTVTVPEPLMRNPITRFIAESYLELRKVTWPTMNEAWTMTIVVIVMSAIVAAILGVADAGLVKALGWFLSTTHAGAPVATPTPTPAVPGLP